MVETAQYETIIWIIVSYIVGCISMFTYVCVRLRQFGWSWRMITGKTKEDKYTEKRNEWLKDNEILWQPDLWNWREKDK